MMKRSFDPREALDLIRWLHSCLQITVIMIPELPV